MSRARWRNSEKKIVFFLGAGASLGAGAYAVVQSGRHLPIPTTATFWDRLLRFCKSAANREIIESFLFRYFVGTDRVPARATLAARRQRVAHIDVEEVFTFLSERTRAPSTSPALRTYMDKVWVALVIELAQVFRRFSANAQTTSTYRAFVRDFVKARDTIVSFNYDTVFEDSLAAKYRWHYEGLESVRSSVGVLKPHGSINWEDADPIVVTSALSRALVVAPTHLKFVQLGPEVPESRSSGYLDHSPTFEKVWRVMEKEMREAKVLVFIGYSFPISDLYFSSVLRSVLADRDGAPGVAIVNPDAVAVRQRLQSRFALNRFAAYYDLQEFAKGSRHRLLARLASDASRITTRPS